jgi:hypothetical protein
MYECDDKNQVPYCNVKNFKKWNFLECWALIEHGPHWINFIILIFITAKIDILDVYIKFGTKLFHLTWKKKKENFKTSHRKIEKKNEF